MKAIIISGPFDINDVEFFARVMRSIERQRPDETFRMVIKDLDREPSLQELAEQMDEIFPTLPGDVPIKAIVRRRRRH